MLAACIPVANEIRSHMAGSGAVIVDRLPVELHELEQNRRAAGILSNLISPIMAQDVEGTLLYDVVDDGVKATGNIRRSKTNEEQPFHTDGPWHMPTPKYIGLFCIQPAVQGGYSQVSSLQHSISELTRTYEASLLHSSLSWSRMGQLNEGENPYSDLPIVQQCAGETLIRHYSDYVKMGHKLADRPLNEDVCNLLTDLDQLLAAYACEPFKLEAGQLQYVNNWMVAHARAGFDDPNAQSGRHLVRLWNSTNSID